MQLRKTDAFQWWHCQHASVNFFPPFQKLKCYRQCQMLPFTEPTARFFFHLLFLQSDKDDNIWFAYLSRDKPWIIFMVFSRHFTIKNYTQNIICFNTAFRHWCVRWAFSVLGVGNVLLIFKFCRTEICNDQGHVSLTEFFSDQSAVKSCKMLVNIIFPSNLPFSRRASRDCMYRINSWWFIGLRTPIPNKECSLCGNLSCHLISKPLKWGLLVPFVIHEQKEVLFENDFTRSEGN